MTYSYQWYRATDAAGTGETAITGATAAAYTLTSADAQQVCPRSSSPPTTATEARPRPPNPPGRRSPTRPRSTRPYRQSPAPTSVGGTLTAGTGSWTNTDSDVTYTYQWYRSDDGAGTNETAISGATSASYAPTTSDAHKNLRVVVTASNSQGRTTETASSVRTAVANTAPVNSVVPSITGTAAVGGTLSAGTGTWTDTDSDTVTYTYQWYRATDAAGTGETAITGATAATYALSSADAHKFVRVVVTANDANGSSTQTSASARSGVANTAPSLATPAVLTLTDTAGPISSPIVPAVSPHPIPTPMG